MKVDFGRGPYLTPTTGPRTPLHKRIVKTAPVPHQRDAFYLDLECGHRAIGFGDLRQAGGAVLCLECRAAAQMANERGAI